MYTIVQRKQAIVANVISAVTLNVSFKREFVGDKLLEWHHLIAKTLNANLQESSDKFVLKVHKNGHFSIKSMHMFLESNNTNLLNKETWHVKIPIKNKIFIWYLKNDLLVKDNLARRNWFESKTCHFNSMKKLNIRHLFLTITMLKFFGVLLSLLSELDYRQLVVLEKIRWCGEWQGERDHVWCCRPVI